ncbi:MAG TPA: hypothetical protein VM328_05715, partial [Fimbriimonadaceae bacterium]|nr:hypothetical protein [Fimbriimonadaceae bacterium]
MRVQKVEGLSLSWVPDDKEGKSGHYDEIWAVNRPTTRYFYDGQMMFESDYTHDSGNNTYVDVTRHGLGARGI